MQIAIPLVKRFTPFHLMERVTLLLQIPFVPQRAFHKIKVKDYFRLALFIYSLSASVGIYILYTATTSTILPAWVVAFHPIQGIGHTLMTNSFRSTEPAWYYYVLLAFMDLIGMLLFISLLAVTARAMLEVQIATRKLGTAFLLTSGTISLLLWPLFNYSLVADFITENFSNAFIFVVVHLILLVYYITALVVIYDLSTVKSLWLLTLNLLFLPIWLVGLLINLVSYLWPKSRWSDRAPPIWGIITEPFVTFRSIETYRPWRRALAIYLVTSLIFLSLGWVLIKFLAWFKNEPLNLNNWIKMEGILKIE